MLAIEANAAEIRRALRILARAKSPVRIGPQGATVALRAGHVTRSAVLPPDLVARLVALGLADVQGDRLCLTETRGADHPSQERPVAGLARRRLASATVETADGPADVVVDLEESPLAWLGRRRGRDGEALLSKDALLAGEKLRRDFTRGQMMPRTTANWDAVASSGRRSSADAME